MIAPGRLQGALMPNDEPGGPSLRSRAFLLTLGEASWPGSLAVRIRGVVGKCGY